MDSAPIANVTLDDPFYYLHHFQEVLSWVASRHGDLLNDDELVFVSAFGALPRPARACLLYTSPSPRDATLSRMPSSA